MTTAFRGTFVISWKQTWIDGREAPPRSALMRGSVWRWSGEAVRVDGPRDVLPLGASLDARIRQGRAARMVHRLVGMATGDAAQVAMPDCDNDLSFLLTDGLDVWRGTVIATGEGRQPLAMFCDGLPPADRDLWVTLVGAAIPDEADVALARIARSERASGLVAGTLVETADGLRPVEDLAPGDRVVTADDGLQPILWLRRRRLGGARLFSIPRLRPVTIAAGALGALQDEPLTLAPDHRVLVAGEEALKLFGAPEVLVRARDLLELPSVRRDLRAREAIYVQFVLPRHGLVRVNGAWVETLHPADAEALSPTERAALFEALPGPIEDARDYGPHARRCLERAEAAILCHRAA